MLRSLLLTLLCFTAVKAQEVTTTHGSTQTRNTNRFQWATSTMTAYATWAHKNSTLNLDPRAVIAQMALESTWGESILAKQAHNYSGIKAFGDSNFILLPTKEEVAGNSITINAKFRRFTTLEEYWTYQEALLKKRYPQVANTQGTEFFKALQAKDWRWATDSKYILKCTAVLNKLPTQPPIT